MPINMETQTKGPQSHKNLYYLSELTEDEIESLKSFIISNEIEAIINNLSTKTISGPDIFISKFFHTH